MKIQSWYVCGVVGASFFLGACSLIPQQNVSVQLKIKPPSAQLSAALARSALTDKGSPTASARLRTDFCYAINVTGDHPLLGSVTQDQAALCQKGGPRPGLVKGLYKVGDVAVLEVPAGAKRRFDLLAFPMQGTSCEGSFELSQTAPGDFSAKLGGTVIPTGSVVAATAVQDVITDSTVELIEQTDTTLAFGAKAGCLKPEVTSVQVSGTTFTINGSNLDTVSSVKLKDMNVPFEIISKTAAVIQAKALSSLSVVLGQTYNLLVSNALGDTTVQVNVSLADGSVAPEKLDMTKEWPFTRKISLTSSMIQEGTSGTVGVSAPSGGHGFVSLTPGIASLDIGAAIDGSNSTATQTIQVVGVTDPNCYTNNMTPYSFIKIDLGREYFGNLAIKAEIQTTINNTSPAIHVEFSKHSMTGWNEMSDLSAYPQYSGTLLANTWYPVEGVSPQKIMRYVRIRFRGDCNTSNPADSSFKVHEIMIIGMPI